MKGREPLHHIRPRSKHDVLQEGYTLRAMACLAGSLLLLIGLFRWWPPRGAGDVPNIVFNTSGQEVIEIEEVLQTSQREKKPPPPAPLPPIIVPDDDILDDPIVDITDDFLPVDEPGEDLVAEAGADTGTEKQVRSQVGPKPVRIVEPEYTREAQKKKIRAEVVVEVLVNAHGRVDDARILERFLLGKDKDDPRTPVPQLGYGLEEAALAAARGWMFRPARENGQPVPSYTALTFSFGI